MPEKRIIYGSRGPRLKDVPQSPQERIKNERYNSLVDFGQKAFWVLLTSILVVSAIELVGYDTLALARAGLETMIDVGEKIGQIPEFFDQLDKLNP